MTLERHYSTKELAALMSCSQATVLRFAQRGDIPSVYWGGERRYPESGVVAYLNRTAQKANPKANVVPLRKAQ